MELPRPAELLDLADGLSMTFRVKGWMEGTTRIFPTNWETQIYNMLNRNQITADQAQAMRAAGKEINVLRVMIPPEEKPHGAPYLDITSTTLIEQLRPYINTPGFQGKRFTITSIGVAPQRRYRLEVKPA